MTWLAWIKAIIGGALLAGVLAGGWYYGHTRYMAGEATKQGQIDNLTAQLASAASALDAANAATLDARAKSAAAQARAAQAVRSAEASAAKARALNAAWQKKLEDAQQDPSCSAVLRMQICPALKGY